jgi:hypothetical protein
VFATDPHQVFHRSIEAVWRIDSARGITRLIRLTATAKGRAIDLFRRDAVAERKYEELARELEALERVIPFFSNHLCFQTSCRQAASAKGVA